MGKRVMESEGTHMNIGATKTISMIDQFGQKTATATRQGSQKKSLWGNLAGIQDKQKLHEARRNDPALDRMLYDQEKAEMENTSRKIQAILRKIARGKQLTPEEKALVQNDPDVAAQVQKIQQEREMLKQQLKHATPQEAQTILSTQLATATGGKSEEAAQDGEIKAAMISELMAEYADGSVDEDDEEKETGLFDTVRGVGTNQSGDGSQSYQSFDAKA